jgi:hypothetical protein
MPVIRKALLRQDLSDKKSGAVSANQLERHVEDQLPVSWGNAAEKLAQPIEEFPGFAGTAPLITFGGSILREDWNFRLPRRRRVGTWEL